MRKVFAFALVVAVMFAGIAFADDSEKMTFDDVTFGNPYKIKGYASVTLLGFKFVNTYAQWDDGNASSKQTYRWIDRNPTLVYSEKPKRNSGQLPAYDNCNFYTSGNEAEFAWLKVDITSLQKNEKNFMKDITVKVVYDDEYEYNGGVRQFNYDYSKSEIYSINKEAGVIGWPVCLSPSDEMSISPMYKGHYAFICTVPNFVVEDKQSPLRMIINVGGHTLTYNIRK